jgi:hypothetical protein
MLQKFRGLFKYLVWLIPGLPILYFQWSDVVHWLSSGYQSVAGVVASSESDGRDRELLAALDDDPSPLPAARRRQEFAPVSLESAIDFTITMPWVLAKWPRVTTQLSLLELQGYRAALVTGTREDDIAGSITYYFDDEDVLKRITFRGKTGDTRRLVRHLESHLGFKRTSTTNPNVYLYQTLWNGKPSGQLWIQPAAVIHSDNRLERFEITLAVDRPSSFSAHGIFSRRDATPSSSSQ